MTRRSLSAGYLLLLGSAAAAAAAAAAATDTVSIPQTAHDGATVMAVDSTGKAVRVQVPQGFDAANPTCITIRNKGLVMPPPTLQEQTSMQVHLHHSGPNAVAISWATPTALNCTPLVYLNDGDDASTTTAMQSGVTQSGVTRSYPGAYLDNKTIASSFQHVVLSGLQEGKNYSYSVRCDGQVKGQDLYPPLPPSSIHWVNSRGHLYLLG